VCARARSAVLGCARIVERLCGEAESGQILISPRIFSNVEAAIDAEVVGELTLKGFQRTVLAHNVKTKELLAKASCKATPDGEIVSFKSIPVKS